MKNFSFILKNDRELSREEKIQMHNLLVKTYPKPSFVRLYNKHGYYSTVKPQMNFLIKKEGLLVGTGKFLWRNIKIKNETIKLFVFGMVVAKEYQNRGLGTNIVKLSIENAKKRKANALFASTSQSKVKKMLSGLGFKEIKTPIFYKDATIKRIKKSTNSVYIFEFKKGLMEKINSLPKIYIGLGPI